MVFSAPHAPGRQMSGRPAPRLTGKESNYVKYLKTTVVAVLAVTGVSALAIAHEGATGMVMHRMEAMKEIGKGMKTIAAMVKGEQAFDRAAVQAAAVIIAEHGRHMPHMFPEGTLDKPTEALPVIWTRWEDFTGLARDMETSALALAEAARTASSAQDILPQLGEVGKSCKSCHESFRLAQ
jgi:cytochrome c556